MAPDTVAMMLTGMAKRDVAVSALHEGGVYRFPTKPWEPDDLRKTLDDCLEQYGRGAKQRRCDDAFEESQQEIIRAARIDKLMDICNRGTFDGYHADLVLNSRKRVLRGEESRYLCRQGIDRALRNRMTNGFRWGEAEWGPWRRHDQ